jgi:signal transduction histidine kinase
MPDTTDNIFILVVFATIGTFILATSFVFFFLRYQRRAQQQREALQQAELSYSENLLNAALQSQEEERRRIGRDLHDDVGASLANLRMVLSRNAPTTDSEPAYKPLIDHIISTVRSISHSLSPPGLELFGLEHTLHELFDSFNASGQLRLVFENEIGSRLDALPKETALALYRVVQELLANTVKHAGAQNVRLRFYEQDRQLVMRYADDGKGMPTEATQKAGMGMQNIVGRLRMIQTGFSVDTAPGKGFAMTVILPF